MMRSSPPLLASLDDTTSSPTSPSSTSRFGAGRARGPPARSQTYDDHYYLGPGAPSAQTRGYAPGSTLPSIASGSSSPSTSSRDFAASTLIDGWPAQFSTEPGRAAGAGAIGSGAAASAGGAAVPSESPSLRSYGQQPQWGQPQVAPQHYSSSTASPSAFSTGAFQPPRALGLYNQQNHSSPSLAFPSRNSGSSEPPVVPPVPSLDDINLGLENMSFEQREHRNSGGGSSVGPGMGSGRVHTPGQDGAMEIRGREGTASVYSIDSMYSTASGQGPSGAVGGNPNHARRTSNNSMRQSYGAVGAEHRRVSQQSGIPDDEASSLPYDDHYREVPQYNVQHAPQGSPHPSQYPDYYNGGGGGGQGGGAYYDGSGAGPSGGAYGAPPPQLHHNASYASSAYGSEASLHQGAPQFSPQPPHGGWGYEQGGVVAAQNPYYAAQFGSYPNDTGVWGQHQGPLNRQPSTMSSMSMASGAMMLGPPGGGPLGRSASSLHIPAAQPRMTRKGTGSSNGSAMSNNSGPPITKASVDEYRQRIKADPDPEAQFNFAKYLIEAAKKINSSSSGDEKSAKKYRDALLAESLKLIKRLATQGSGVGKPAYADAQFFLANCLGNGSLGLQVDHEKAYNLYVQASKQNHSSATYRTAVCNEVGAGTRRDHARAVLFYRKASALGDTAGMYKLGMLLLNGLLGQQRNPKEAVNWLKRAASQADEDNPHALHELGLLYEKPPPPVQPTGPNGGPPMLVVPYDPAQARELFTQAGQLGYPPSQFKLGSCYEYGSLTCPVDPRRSIAWYTRAAERGDAESELALSGWYLTGSEGVLKQSDSEAYLWARRAANKGLPKAEYAVGYYSEVGIGVKQDLEEAKRWYMRSAAQGNKRAMQRLTELKKLGATKGPKSGKGQARPTRQEAATECIVM